MNAPYSGKRIAIVYRTVSGLSGVPGVVLDHARRLSELGHRVSLIGETFDRERVARTGADSIRVRKLPLPKLWRLRWFMDRAGRLSRNFDFVVGHGHGMRQHVFHLHNCIRLAYEKMHGQEPPPGDPVLLLQERMLRQAEFTLCIANSRLMQRELTARYGIPENRIRVVYPGSDLTRFNTGDGFRHREAVRRELGVGASTLVAGLITSGDFRKRGVDIAIDGFAELPAALRRQTLLLIAGRESRLEEYRRLAAARGLDGQIRFLPPTPQVERYYHALDLYIHPARFEEFGLSVQEAMACGLPVIASRQVGATELLPPAARDSLPVQLDAPELAARLRHMIEDEKLRQQWRDFGLQAVANNSDAASFERVLAVYREAGL
ncbi:MAG TPA: glycosyltransferase family 4 protein [Gammaproteobacteria bacterium]|nr:glycosyltransferase family 4 protein [Gammaproteobacteria bacterium]